MDRSLPAILVFIHLLLVSYSLSAVAIPPDSTIIAHQNDSPFSSTCASPYVVGVYSVNPITVKPYWREADSLFTHTVRWRKQTSETWSYITNVTSWSCLLADLEPDTGYEFQVKRQCELGGDSEFAPTTPYSFTTWACDVVTGLESSPGHDHATLSWPINTAGVTYTMRYRTVNSPDWTIGVSDFYIPNISAQIVSLTGLTNNTAYEWQVAIRCSPTSPLQAYSPSATFTTVCANTPQSFNSVNITYNSAHLRFDFTPDAPPILHIRPQGGTWQLDPTASYNYSNGFVSLTGLMANTVYEWKVATPCSATDVSAFGAVQSFTTLPCTNGILWQAASDVVHNTAKLRWNSNTGNSFVIQYKPQTGNTWVESGPLAGSVYSLTGLVNNTVYEWQVAEVCSPTQRSTFTSPTTFTTICPAPTDPRTGYPWYNGNTFYWTGISGATFEFDHRAQGATTWQQTTNIRQPYYSVTGIPSGGYEWRVRAVCSDSSRSAYAGPLSYSTICQTPTSWVSSVSSYAATLDWNQISFGSVYLPYLVQWRRANGQWQQADTVRNVLYTITNLMNTGVYEARVQLICSPIQSSEWSAVRSFTATCPDPKPTYELVNMITWRAILGASYQVQWRLKNTQDWQSSPVLNDLNSTKGVYDISWSPAGTYEWRVKTICNDGYESAYVAGFDITISGCSARVPAQFQLICSSSTSVRLDWWGTTSANTLYQVRWRAVGAVDWNYTSGSDSVVTTASDVGTYFMRPGIGNLSPGATYEWWVKPLCPNELTQFSYAGRFFTPNTPPVITPNVICVGSAGAQLGWDHRRCSIEKEPVELQWRPTDALAWNTVESFTSNVYALTGLTPDTNYEYRIRWLGGSNPSSNQYSVPVSFTTHPSSSPALLVSRADNQNFTSRTVSWLGCTNCSTGYELRYREVGTTPWQTAPVAPNRNWAYLTALTELSTYEIQIRVICADAPPTDYGPSTTFTVGSAGSQCKLADGICHYAITATEATLQWRGIGPFELRWRVGGTSTWTTVVLYGDVPIYKLLGLANNTTYEWQVRTLCSGQRGFSNSDHFRTICNAPFQLRLVARTPTSVTLRWSPYGYNSFAVQWRERGQTNWQTALPVTTSTVTLRGLKSSTVYEWRVQTDCSGESSPTHTPIATFVTEPCGNEIFSLKDGVWNDPSVWSCNRVPVASDVVQIRHSLTLPANSLIEVYAIGYDMGGQLRLDVNSRLLVHKR
ncbi:MAG: fibronectin type III domain-containing protein [Cytophagales bacterium]|nr:MAG: fibronectin type III domain-containing protein [Cytophagales bacterium]